MRVQTICKTVVMKELTLIEPINDGDDEKINHENDEEEINADSYDQLRQMKPNE